MQDSTNTKPQNGAATGALIVGIVGVLIGLSAPIANYWLTAAAGAAALVLGLIGTSRANEHGVGRTAAVWGIVLGVAALILAAIQYSEVQAVMDELDRQLNRWGY